MATTTTYTIGNGLSYDGKKTVTVPKGTTALNVATLAGQTYEDAKGKTVTIKAGAITEINASSVSTPITIAGSTNNDDKADKAVSVTLGGGKTAGGLVTGGGKGDKFFGGKGNDTFGLGAGDQVGAATKGIDTNLLYGSGDVITINAAFEGLSFTDAPAKKTVTITDASKKKYTIYKQSVDTPLTIYTHDDTVAGNLTKHTYGTDGSTSFLDSKGKEVTIKSGSGTVDVSTIAAGVKIIDATALTDAVNLIGNGQADNISIGSGGGTLYGGYNYDPAKKTTKATADNLYGTTTPSGAVVFYADANAGADNIYNYKNGDTIKLVTGGKSSLNFADNKVLKDGGSGKDVVITYNGNNKVTVKNHGDEPIKLQYVSLTSAGAEAVIGTQTYGVDFSTVAGTDGGTAGLNAKRTAITLGGAARGTVGIQGWKNEEYTGDATDTALSLVAPKLNEIDASAATGTNVSLALNAHPTVASVLRGAAGGNTTMYGGTGNDQFYGGDGHDVLVFDVSTLTGGKYTAIGKDVVNSIEAGDLIMLKGYNDSIHNDVQVSDKGVITFTDDKTDQKTNSITVKTFKPGRNATEQPVVVIDDTGKILAVNSFSGAPAPIGATLSSKSGLVTGSTFNGKYKTDAYVVGATVNIANGKVSSDVNDQLTLTGRAATIDAAAYGGALKAIDARSVASTLTSLYIKGNETAKNTIYAPTLAAAAGGTADLKVTLEGGTGADTFNRDSDATKVAATYVFDATGYDAKASKPKVTFGKDIISNYVEGDIIEIALPTTASVTGVTDSGTFGSFLEGKITEKNSDVIVTLDKSNILTIKDAATKAIHFKSGDHSYYYGYTLPSGLEYDKKHTAINAVTLPAGETSEFEGDINLRTGHYYAGVKTVSLTGSTVNAYVYGSSTNANEIYAGTGNNTLFGGSVLNMTTGEGSKKKALKATADKLYGNTGSDTFVYMEGEGADVIGNTKGNNAHTLFQDHDRLILASNNSSALTRDDITITDKKNVLTITIGTTKDKFTVNKAATDTKVEISLTSAIDSLGSYSTVGSSFVYGMNEAEFAGTLDLNKGNLTISGGGTAYTVDDGSATLASAELRNVASGIKNVYVNAGSDTAVYVAGDQRNGNALTINMGLGGGTVEGSAKVKINEKKADTLTASGYEETFTGNKDSVVLNTAATKGTTFILSSVSGADQITNYDASRGDVIYFKDPIDNVSVIRTGKGIQFSYDNKNSVIINATNPDEDFDVNIYGKYTSGTGTAELSGKLYGWDTKSTKLVKLKDNVRDTSWSRSGNTFTYKGTGDDAAEFTLTSGSLLDTDGDYIPDGVAVNDSKLDFTGVKNYINPLVNNFHVAGTGIDANTQLAVNGVTYSLQDVDTDTAGFELTANSFVKTGSSQVVYYDTNFDSSSAKFTLTSFNDPGGTPTVTGTGDNTVNGELHDGYLDKFLVTGGTNISINHDSSEGLASAHIELPASVASVPAPVSAYTVTLGSGNATAAYKLYDGNGDASDGYEFLRTDLADAAKWTLLTGAADTESQQANGTGVWKFANDNTAFLVSAASSLKPDDSTGLPTGVSTSSTTEITYVTFDNGFTVANKGFAKTEDDDFIYHSTMLSNSAGTNVKVDYLNYDVGGLNQFTLSGLVDAADTSLTADLAHYSYTNNVLTISDTVDPSFSNDAHVKFSDAFLEAGDSVVAIAAQTINIGTGNTTVASYKLYDGDGDATNGAELLRTDIANAAGWTLLTGVQADDRLTDSNSYAYQSNGTGSWSFSSDTTGNNKVGYSFVISSEASLAHTDDGTPIGVSVSGNSDTGLTITVDKAKVNPEHILFGKDATFGSSTGAVHISGFDLGTEFTIGEDGETYQLAQLDNKTTNGYELLKVNANSGWSIKDGVWTFDNKSIVYNGKSASDNTAIPQVKFSIASDATVNISDKGLPVGVTVNVENEVASYLGEVSKVTFATTQTESIKPEYISFETVGNSDIEAPTKIIGLSGDADAAPTFTMGDGNEYYLVNLDNKADDAFEFLRKDDHWLRTANGWMYFNDSSKTKFNNVGSADITLTGSKPVYASADGTPRGLSVERKYNATAGSETYIVIDSSLGTINDDTGTTGEETVELKPAQLSLSSTTSVNSATGFHITGVGSATETFKAGTTFSIVFGDNTTVGYKLANLDRDASNGYELLATTGSGWTFNNGEDSVHPVGSWTYSNDVGVGTATSSGAKFYFDLSAKANRLGEGATIGSPSDVTVTTATGDNDYNITITGGRSLNAGMLVFDSNTAAATFLANGGLHLNGNFESGQTIVVATPTTEAPNATKTYRLTELSGNAADGLELLQIEPSENWSLEVVDNTLRAWTYSNSGIGIKTLTVSTESNLAALSNGVPANITLSGTGEAATIAVTPYASDAAEGVAIDGVRATSLVLNPTDSDTNIGSGGTLHFVGFDTNTTLVVGSGDATANYVLANMDSNADDLELLKVNEKWKFYSQNATIGSGETPETLKAGTWIYTDTNVKITLSSDAGLVGSAKHVAAADKNGAPVGITIDTATSVINLDKDKLNINSATGVTGANLLGNVTFASVTGDKLLFGKDGLHFVGVDSDTTLAVDGATYYFAELDSSLDNGYELTPVNDHWHRTASGWSYQDTLGTDYKIGFKLNDTIDVVEKSVEGSVAQSLVGSPNGVMISASKSGDQFTFSDTITFGSAQDASLITFESIVSGVNGLHITGVDIDSRFTVGDKTYALKELTGDTSTGLELLAQDANWTLNNTGDNNEKRVWSFASDTALSFSVGYQNEGITSCLAAISGDNGQPVGASVSVDSSGEYYVTFGASATGAATVGLDMVTIDSAADLTKIHIKGFADTATDGTGYLYATDTSKMFTIGTDQYYLAELDGKTDNGYELIKNDDNWHRYATGWYYNNTDTNVYFQVASTTSSALLAAEKGDTVYTGKPVEVGVNSVKVNNLTYQNVSIDSSAKIELVFGHATSPSDTRITYANYASNQNTTSALDAATKTPTFQFAKFSTESATVGSGDSLSGSDSDLTTYYLAHTDTVGSISTDTWAFVKTDDHWKRFDNGWLYRDKADSTTFSFFITSTNPSVKADGTPQGITVDSNSRVITIDSDTAKFGGATARSFIQNAAKQLIFFGDNTIGAYNRADGVTIGAQSTHINVNGYENDGSPAVRYFEGVDSSVGVASLDSSTTTVSSGNSTKTAVWYQLTNADANTVNGVELTFNGWANTSVTVNNTTVEGYLYQNGWGESNTAANYTSFIAAGSAISVVSSTDSEGKAVENIKGFTKVSDDGIITFGDSSVTISKVDVDNFKVFGSTTTKTGTTAEGTQVKAYIDNSGAPVTFTLKDAYKKTTNDDGALELTHEGWSKQTIDGGEMMFYSNTGIAFTLQGSSATTLDADNDLLPDVMQKVGHKPRFDYDANEQTLSIQVGDANTKQEVINKLRFSFAAADSETMPSKIIVNVYDSSTSKYVHEVDGGSWGLASIGSDSMFSITTVASAAAGGTGQLPADDAWANTGYDIDDLLGGVTGTNADAAVSELDEIIDIKPLAAEAAASVFDPDSAFTEVGKDKTIQSLTYGARHKARK